MSKVILHMFLALLVLDLSFASTTYLNDHRELKERHRNRREQRQLHQTRLNPRSRQSYEDDSNSMNDDSYLPSPSVRRPVSNNFAYNRQFDQEDDEDLINAIFGPEQEAVDNNQQRVIRRRMPSVPAFYQSNVVPGSYINNNFNQHEMQRMRRAIYPPFYQPQPNNYGLGSLTINVNCNHQPQQPSQNNNPNVRFKSRFAEIDYDKEYYNTPTGITLDKIPPKRNDTRPPPPIAHGPSTQRPIQTTTRRAIQTTTRRPIQTTTKKTTTSNSQRPGSNASINRPPQESGVSNNNLRPNGDPKTLCAIAIIQCCNGDSYSHVCFSKRGCPGPFFGNPCETSLAKEYNNFVDTLYFSS